MRVLTRPQVVPDRGAPQRFSDQNPRWRGWRVGSVIAHRGDIADFCLNFLIFQCRYRQSDFVAFFHIRENILTQVIDKIRFRQADNRHQRAACIKQFPDFQPEPAQSPVTGAVTVSSSCWTLIPPVSVLPGEVPLRNADAARCGRRFRPVELSFGGRYAPLRHISGTAGLIKLGF